MAEDFNNNLEGAQEKSGDILSPKEQLEKDLLDTKELIFSSEWNDKLGNQADSKLLCNEILDNLSDPEKENFIEAVNNILPFELDIYIGENGYPINNETFDFFAKQFGIEQIKENVTETQENITEIEEKDKEITEKEKQKAEKCKTVFKETFGVETIVLDGIDQSIIDSIKKINGLKIEEIDDILKEQTKLLVHLEKNPEELTKILEALHSLPGSDTVGSSFSKFTSYLEDQKGYGFAVQIEKFKKLNSITPITETVNTAVVENSTKVGGFYMKDIGGNQGLRIDNSKRPPESVVTNDREYKLNAKLGVGNFYEPTLRYEMDARKFNKKIDEVNSKISPLKDKGMKVMNIDLGSSGGEDELFGMFAGPGNQNIRDLIESYDFDEETGLTPENAKELKGKIQNILGVEYKTLKDKYDELIEDFKDREEQYHDELDALKKKYFDNIGEQQKETLKKIHETGFDIFPQKEITDKLINDYKSNVISIPGLDFKRGTLDLANGRFGESVSDVGGTKWIDNLVMFMEKAIYGEIGHKDSVFKGLNFKMGATVDPTKFKAVLEDRGIVSGGNWNIKTLRDNLEKDIVDEGSNGKNN